ncbi:MAG: hypothetical protein Q9164_001558 [Protoblastenia rupestris]
METALEEDVKLQRTAADSIAQLERSLPLLLRKSTISKNGSQERWRVRRLVRESKVQVLNKLVSYLDQFQELPQLLDRHLSRFVQALSSAFLEYVEYHNIQYHALVEETTSQDAIPLPRAICRILYTLCKVRGQKIIAQLLNNEPRYLEPILQAFQNWSQPTKSPKDVRITLEGGMVWEERYVMLLWLSHLTLIPFDLTTVGSNDIENRFPTTSLALSLVPGTPSIAARLVSLAVYHLGVPGKEREAARALLVRLVLRTDMLRLRLHEALINWALTLVEFGNVETEYSTYESIGALSFLAGFAKSADDVVMRQMFKPIWQSIRHMLDEQTAHFDSEQTTYFESTLSSAVVRKLLVKIHCRLGVAAHRLLRSDRQHEQQQVLGCVITYQLEALDDTETSVRLTASKALGVLALQFGPKATSLLIEALEENLRENLSWTKIEDEEGMPDMHRRMGWKGWRPDYTCLIAVKWHGCVLTLAQLLFRRAIPLNALQNVLSFISLALSFDQRSPLGASIGTNIRDAACFGMWALSRKYTSQEIMGVLPDTWQSLLQRMANDLVEAACLDLSGNIRRGASAALQELVGRHPDTVSCGIALVQCVDYHAVASRHGAMTLVAIQAAEQAKMYEDVVFRGLLGWRGLESPDAATRRLSAETIGSLLCKSRFLGSSQGILYLKQGLCKTHLTEIEHRHGLILALAHVIEHLHTLFHRLQDVAVDPWGCLSTDKSVILDSTSGDGDNRYEWGRIFDLHRDSLAKNEDVDAAERSQYTHEARSRLIWTLTSAACFRDSVQVSLNRQEKLVLEYSSQAMVGFLMFIPTEAKRKLLESLISMVRMSSHKVGAILAVGHVTIVFHDPLATYGTISPEVEAIIETLIERTQLGNDIEVRCAALQSLAHGPLLLCKLIPEGVVPALQACLDDYTIDHRGDVGSQVRIAAIDAAGVALRNQLVQSSISREHMVARICSLAAEKLDKVRLEASQCLQASWSVLGLMNAERVAAADIHDTTTSAYFSKVLALRTHQSTSLTILTGFVSTAGDGSTSLLQSSRKALVSHTEQMPLSDLSFLCTNFVEIVRDHNDDRISIWAMEVIAFLFDAHIIQRLLDGDFGWRNLFTTINKAHFKSTDIRRLEAAIAVYSALTAIHKVKIDVLRKLCDMLRNPFAKIRNLAADALFSALQDEQMLTVNWSRPPNELKSERDRILTKLGTTT